MAKCFFRFSALLLMGLVFVTSALPISGVEGEPLRVTITTNTFIDESDASPNANCSLREAVYSAIIDDDYGGCTHTGEWSTSTYDNDEIQLSHGTYNLTLGRINMYGSSMPSVGRSLGLSPTAGGFDVIIMGAPAGSTIDAGGTSRVFFLSSIAVRMELISITGGSTESGDPFGGGIASYNSDLTLDTCLVHDNHVDQSGSGGGIANLGTLTLDNVVLMDNYIEPSSGAANGGNGGGLYNDGAAYATDVYFVNNHTGNNNGTGSSGSGGAIYNRLGSSMLLNRVTISNNGTGNAAAYPTGGGGGIYNLGEITLYTSTITGNFTGDVASGDNYAGSGAGIYDNGTMMIRDSTIADNQCGEGSGTAGCLAGGIQAFGTVTARNTIIADNTADEGPDCAGSIISDDYLLLENSVCSLSGTTIHNILGQDPKLGPLAHLGGLSWVHPLMLGSPAIDAGPNTCLSPDQRHLSRAKDGDGDGSAVCDIGAYEAYLWQFFPLLVKP